ncbi:hypothetical protein ACLM5H_16870 [Fredinandcohnia humi]
MKEKKLNDYLKEKKKYFVQCANLARKCVPLPGSVYSHPLGIHLLSNECKEILENVWYRIMFEDQQTSGLDNLDSINKLYCSLFLKSDVSSGFILCQLPVRGQPKDERTEKYIESIIELEIDLAKINKIGLGDITESLFDCIDRITEGYVGINKETSVVNWRKNFLQQLVNTINGIYQKNGSQHRYNPSIHTFVH